MGIMLAMEMTPVISSTNHFRSKQKKLFITELVEVHDPLWMILEPVELAWDMMGLEPEYLLHRRKRWESETCIGGKTCKGKEKP